MNPIKTVEIQKFANHVIEWNGIAYDGHDYSMEKMKQQWEITLEEYTELIEGLNKGDAVEVVDGLCDLFITASYLEYLVNYEDVYKDNGYNLSWYGTTKLDYDLGKTLGNMAMKIATMVESDTISTQEGDTVPTIGFIEDVLIGCIDLMYIMDVDINGAMENVLDSNDSKMPLYDATMIPHYHQEATRISNDEGIVCDWHQVGNRVVFRNEETGKIRKPKFSFFEPSLVQFIPEKYL